MFVGRDREFAKLNAMFSGERFECVIVYGRRRIGKTALIQEFIRDKKAIYFLAMETNEQMNLAGFGKSVSDAGFPGIKTTPRFADFADAFDMVGDLAADERIVLVIDEYPYLAATVKGISSILQARIDMRYQDTKLFLILCGSSMSIMENQVLGYQSPLYGRRTAQFKIERFSFFESAVFHKGYDIYDQALLYGITGGVPRYLAVMDPGKSLKYNIINGFFDPSSYLYEEPSNLLKQELREPAMYNSVISAIATGSSRLNEIATKNGLVTAVCSKYLATLMSLGIIKKETPVLADSRKKTIYRLADGMFQFWYRFVQPNASQIQSGAGDRVYGRIEEQIPGFMGEVFEDICLQWLWKINLAESLPFVFQDAGRWWGTDPVRKREQEIDIVAFDDRRALFCECKWQNEKTGISVFHALVEKSAMFRHEEKYYALFSKAGFTDDLLDKKGGEVMLVSYQEMMAGLL